MPGRSDDANRLERQIGRARLIIGFERLWPILVLVVSVAGVFLLASWLGVWLVVPTWMRPAGLAAFLAAFVLPIGLAMRSRAATRAEALARLDRDSGQRHRPVSASQDRLADPKADPLTIALWELHRRRVAEAAASVRLAPPSPRVVERDRFALRGALLVALVAAAFVAGTDKQGRLASAFAWRSPIAAGTGFRIDAWIDPPPYTGRAPVLLSGLPAGLPDQQSRTAVPVNSTVVIRSSGEGAIDVTTDGGLKPAAPAIAKAGLVRSDAAERRFLLTGDGHIAVAHDGSRQSAFDLQAVPDHPPTIALTEPPKSNLRGSLTLAYKVDDDYGVIGVDAAFSAPTIDGKPIAGRTLVEAPKLPLGLPNGARGLGQGQTTADLSAHPWAGAEVTLVLSARDEGGNVGLSTPVTVRMPMRPFHKALARALVEQRRALVFDPDHRGPIEEALDALAVAPDLFGTTPAVYLGLTSAKTRLIEARSDADLAGVADLLWSMALSIEDGDLSQTERDLRALQRDLKDALARGAPPEEIKTLTEALKQQMEKFLAELAQRNGEPPGHQPPSTRQSKMVTQKDLQSLLDRMEQSARDGDMAEAQQLLDRLQNILENLRSAQQGEDSDQNAQQMSRSMGQLDRMMRDQQALRDKTFKRGNSRNASRRPPDDGQDSSADPGDSSQGDDGPDPSGEAQNNADLQTQQKQLREALQRMQNQMRELGMSGEQGLGDAEQAMRDAEGALGQGGSGNDQAVGAQGRALQGLQRGAQDLQRQMAQGQGQGEGEGGDMPGELGTGRADGSGQNGTDPLGRERKGSSHGLDVQGGLNLGAGAGERARQVLEELRRRLGDRLRPQEEQDYLERLLRRY